MRGFVGASIIGGYYSQPSNEAVSSAIIAIAMSRSRGHKPFSAESPSKIMAVIIATDKASTFPHTTAPPPGVKLQHANRVSWKLSETAHQRTDAAWQFAHQHRHSCFLVFANTSSRLQTMVTTADAPGTAIAHHQAGRLPKAEPSVLDRFCKPSPTMPGRMTPARPAGPPGRRATTRPSNLISQAIALRGDQPAFHSNLGEVYRAMGKLTEAGQSFRQALQIERRHARGPQQSLATCCERPATRRKPLRPFAPRSGCVPSLPRLTTTWGRSSNRAETWKAAIACHRRAMEFAESLLCRRPRRPGDGTGGQAETPADAIRYFEQALQLAPAQRPVSPQPGSRLSRSASSSTRPSPVTAKPCGWPPPRPGPQQPGSLACASGAKLDDRSRPIARPSAFSPILPKPISISASRWRAPRACGRRGRI